VRVPVADGSLHKLPEGVSDEEAVMLSDILPTGFEIGATAARSRATSLRSSAWAPSACPRS
jgi:threonine dehydrogenase-like Zn-dependent dehydrogenase